MRRKGTTGRKPKGSRAPASSVAQRRPGSSPQRISRPRRQLEGTHTIYRPGMGRKLEDGGNQTPRSAKLYPQRDNLPRGLLHRGTAVPALPRAKKSRLPPTFLPLSRRNEKTNQSKATPCARKKETRRSVIIATGHGGINKARNYRKQKPC